MRPMPAQLVYAHDFFKIRHVFANIPKFRTIIDTTNTPTTKSVQLLTINSYTLKDSFNSTNKIKSISSEMFEDGYQFVSFDVEFLFMNVLLNKTINII